MEERRRELKRQAEAIDLTDDDPDYTRHMFSPTLTLPPSSTAQITFSNRSELDTYIEQRIRRITGHTSGGFDESKESET